MTKVLAENENNDVYVGSNNQINIYEDLHATMQACKASVEIQKNEALYAQDNGVPNITTIWDGTPNLRQFEHFARKQITNVPKVINVNEFTSWVDNDTVQYQATIETEYGTDEINGSL